MRSNNFQFTFKKIRSTISHVKDKVKSFDLVRVM